jgi:flagellar hook-associated protein 1 FlgK
MSIDSINSALAGLGVTKARIDTISQNIANAQTPGYSKKIGEQTTGPTGAVSLAPVQRNVDAALAKSLREATGTQNQLQTTVTLLSQIETAFGTPSDNTSLSAQITNLQSAFQDLSVNPEKSTLYDSVISAANGVTRTLNQLSQTVTDTGTNASTQLNQAVTTVNQTLTALDAVNGQIVAHSGNEDTSDLQDQRDRLLGTLSGLMDITTFAKPNGAIAVYTRDGKPLVDASVATVGLGGATGLTWSTPGSPAAPINVQSGTIGGLLNLQNTTLKAVQGQLDGIAGALTAEFNKINVPIFYQPGATPVNTTNPPAGYAGTIAVNPTVTQGTIHDGAPVAQNLVANTPPLAPGDTTFIDKAAALFESTSVAFNAPGLPKTGNLAQVATDFITSQSLSRANAEDALNSETTLQQTLQTKLSAESGVNVDDEVAQLTVLQNAYAANARVLQTSQELFTTLFTAIT